MSKQLENIFSLEGKVAVVTGAGVLGAVLCEALAVAGAKVAILNRTEEKAIALAEQLKEIQSGVLTFQCDVTDENRLKEVCEQIVAQWGKIDILLNGAGGNMPGATISPEQTVFDMKLDDFKKVMDLNLIGSILPSLVFGKEMAKQKKGVIINLSSMTAQQAVTRVFGYSVSKAAIDNFTRWMAVEMALKFGEGIRVNAIAPGFFIGDQNRKLLTNVDGTYTARGNTIITNTPMKRFGKPNELVGALLWLVSDASSFVTGVIVPVDGGFSAFSGV